MEMAFTSTAANGGHLFERRNIHLLGDIDCKLPEDRHSLYPPRLGLPIRGDITRGCWLESRVGTGQQQHPEEVFLALRGGLFSLALALTQTMFVCGYVCGYVCAEGRSQLVNSLTASLFN